MNNNQNRCGCGGQPTVMDIDRETKENTNFRKEAWTGEHLQVTLMCIPTNCDIGAEIHEDTDQLVCIVQGVFSLSFMPNSQRKKRRAGLRDNKLRRDEMFHVRRSEGKRRRRLPHPRRNLAQYNKQRKHPAQGIFRICSAAPRGRNSPAHQDLRLLKIK